MDTKAMFDATCTKCRKRFGWFGTLAEKPKCPKCGHHDKPSERDVKAIEDLMQKLREDALK